MAQAELCIILLNFDSIRGRIWNIKGDSWIFKS